MVTKLYHISSDGQARPCASTSVGSCPLTSAGTKHKEFDSADEARTWAGLELAHSMGGSFGKLALQLAEQGIRDEIESVEQEDARRKREKRDSLRSLMATNDEMFTLASLHGLAEAKGLRRRKLGKRWAAVSREAGLTPQEGMASLYQTYIFNTEFDVTTLAGREKIRDRVAAGRLLCAQRFHHTTGGSQLYLHLDKLAANLDGIPNEIKPELRAEENVDSDPSEIPLLTDDAFVQEVKKAGDREWYLEQWRPGRNTRLINYNEGSRRSVAKMEMLLGERYSQVVLQGRTNGFTEDEARYFEDQQPARWAPYHKALKGAAKARLAAS